MKSLQLFSRRGNCRTILTLGLGLALGAGAAVSASAQSVYRQISQDSFTNSTSQHMTEVEPGAASNGVVIVAAFQVARVFGGGGADIGFATSLNSGISWSQGYLPGLTQWEGGGPNSAASDAAVAYNAKYHKWLICTLPIGNFDTVAVSRSSNGITWDNPIYVITNQDADKNWITCDNSPTSPHYGNCYVEWDNPDLGDLLYMSTSTDGGLTWGTPMNTQGTDYGIGGNPVVQPNGTVVVPFADFNGGMSSFVSTNGGQSWTAAVSIANAPSHGESGGLRSAGLPSSAIDSSGKVYLSWPDCSFESGCTANDIVFSSSTDGVHWSAKVRIPLDPIGSGVDHFINGMGIDSNTSGNSDSHGHDLLLLPRLKLREQLPVDRRLLHEPGQRTDLDSRTPAGSPDAVELAAQYLLGQDGSRLRSHGLPGRRPRFPDLCLGDGAHRQHLPRGDFHPGLGLHPRRHAGTDGELGRRAADSGHRLRSSDAAARRAG